MNSFDEIQCEEFIPGDDFLLWVAAMESYAAGRDEEDSRWDDIREEVEYEFAQSQEIPF